MKRILLAALAGLVVSGGAKADPGPVVGWLMKEPASLFDLGMLRLQNRVTSTKDFVLKGMSGGGLPPVVIYSFDKNRIEIHYDTAPPFDKVVCKNTLSLARGSIGAVYGGNRWQSLSLRQTSVTISRSSKFPIPKWHQWRQSPSSGNLG